MVVINGCFRFPAKIRMRNIKAGDGDVISLNSNADGNHETLVVCHECGGGGLQGIFRSACLSSPLK